MNKETNLSLMYSNTLHRYIHLYVAPLSPRDNRIKIETGPFLVHSMQWLRPTKAMFSFRQTPHYSPLSTRVCLSFGQKLQQINIYRPIEWHADADLPHCFAATINAERERYARLFFQIVETFQCRNATRFVFASRGTGACYMSRYTL